MPRKVWLLVPCMLVQPSSLRSFDMLNPMYILALNKSAFITCCCIPGTHKIMFPRPDSLLNVDGSIKHWINFPSRTQLHPSFQQLKKKPEREDKSENNDNLVILYLPNKAVDFLPRHVLLCFNGNWVIGFFLSLLNWKGFLREVFCSTCFFRATFSSTLNKHLLLLRKLAIIR